MDYLYYFGTASLTLRVIEFLHAQPELSISFVSVIHQPNGWVVRIKLQEESLTPQQEGDLRALLNELGIQYRGGMPLQMALLALETGQSPTAVMHRYHVAVVSHGNPDFTEIENFRQQFIEGLGYCPETLA